MFAQITDMFATRLFTRLFLHVLRLLPNRTVDYRNVTFTVWDVGGQDKIRPLWRKYCPYIPRVLAYKRFLVEKLNRFVTG
jgi:GTPase SAR1 family protein